MEYNNDTISKLKFIGKIQKNDKINTKTMTIQKNNFVTQIYRTFIGNDSRDSTLLFIVSVLDNAYLLLNSISHSDTKDNNTLRDNIIKDIMLAREGILNIKYTYSSDMMFICQMDSILQRLDIFLNKYDTSTL